MGVTAPWSAEDFSDLLGTPGAFLVTLPPSSLQKYAIQPDHPALPLPAFALGRTVLEEAELLTLAVDPDHQRQGLGQACLQAFEAEAAEQGAERLFLEVAATNLAAIALYRVNGWSEDGVRSGYYNVENRRVDAILFSKSLKQV